MTDLSDRMVQLDRAQEESKAQAKAHTLNLPYLDLTHQELDYQIMKLIPKEQVEALQCIAVHVHGKELTIGVVAPESTGVKQGLEDLEQMTGYLLKIAVISESSFAYAHKSYELLVRENEGERPVIITEKQASDLESLMQRMVTEGEVKDVNVTDMLSAILHNAITRLSSDIHFEPLADTVEVRFRIDGVLHKVLSRPEHDYRALVSRVKYLAKMPLGSVVHPQDGRFTITVANTPLDLRVASLPTIYGDMITIRILRQEQIVRKLSELGLRPDIEKLARFGFTKPHGMVLVTGPTGSGKTTTLYAIVQELNNEDRKIITIEDPVEYKVKGLEQSQVDVDHGYTFAEALRGALRQDPDVLMVGEVRDQDTASIGIRAALTGHIVLATMHANNAPAAYSRLLEMGVEPFLFSGSINVVIAQRLIRILCPDCKEAHAPTKEQVELLQRELGRVPEVVFEAKGCEKCGVIGYRGRIGVFEAFAPSHEMEQLALMRSSVAGFEDQAIRDGMISMVQDGLMKVEQGITSVAEVMRVSAE